MTSPAVSIFLTLREDLPPEGLSALRSAVRAHYARLVDAQRTSELIAIDLAEALHRNLDALLAVAHLFDPDARAHVVGAARYFVSSSDARPDQASCTGLDDDVEVFNHAALLLDRPDLTLLD